MKTNFLRYALLLGLSLLTGLVSCSGTTEEGDPYKLTALTIDPSEVPSLIVGQSIKLKVKGTPETASLEGLKWRSRFEKFATVDETDGTVTAVAPGTTTITAICDGIKALCELTVVPPAPGLEEILLTPKGGSLLKGNTLELKPSFLPGNAEVEASDVVWASSKTDIATVDQNGVVTGVADGYSVITASVGNISATCPIEVYSNSSSRTLTFFQFNIWEGLRNVKNGTEAFIKQLEELKPDVASFCEFPSAADAHNILETTAEELFKRTGIQYYYNYYAFSNGTRGILTRHPILSEKPEMVAKSQWFYRTIIDYYGQEMAVYASHAYHKYYACYLPRGYGDGEAPYEWNELTEKQMQDVTLDFILAREEKSGRRQIGVNLATDMKEQQALGRLCIFGGDLNQPSHLDWTERTKDMFEHNGYVVEWSISKECYDGGVRDAFRTVYPDEVAHPGVTWPVSNPDAGKDTQWAAHADERDRIDYVYYMPETRFKPVKAQMVGPADMIANSEIVSDTFANKAEELIEPAGGVWPSDHRGLFITFEVKF